jgi:DNA-binding beta-propeller fold protein YncE
MDLPGATADGAVRLPNQWLLRPVGKQVLLGDFPVNIAMHPGGKYAAILHCGYGTHEVIVVEIAAGKIVSRAAVEEAFYGVAFYDEGRRLICSGAGTEVVNLFEFRDGYLLGREEIRLRPAAKRGVTAGVAVSRDGRTAYVANLWGHSVSVVDLVKKTAVDISLGTNAAPGRAAALKPAANEDEAAITKRAEAALEDDQSGNPFPYACVLDESGQRLLVSCWGQARVAVVDLKTRKVATHWAAEAHPNEMLLTRNGRHLLVANANHNTVSVIDTASGRLMETLTAELLPGSPPGSTPNSLALSPDEKRLFIANANINTVAVFDFSTPGKSRSLGSLPVGWYPTSVRVTPDGKKLLVANGKGIISKPNRHGPQPEHEVPATVREYIACLMQGTLGIVDLPAGEAFETAMKQHTARALNCMPAGPGRLLPERLVNNPIPRQLGDPTPIQHVIYIVKENRTYDQMLGDMPQGNGDASLCIFPESVTPNHHALARDFVLLDNFYVESEVSADGHEWTMGAYATDFVEKTWPLSYGHNKSKKFPYPAEGNLEIASPAGGYLWDRAREAGVSYRSYGEWVANSKKTNDPCTAKAASLKGHFDPWYRSFDTDYPDVLRAARFISELKRFEREGDMPRLQIVRLPNDHTSGTAVGKHTPTAQVADNDLALGQVIEALTQSKFWPHLAIFIVEDDAQNGPDHVDAHRTIAYAISPYIRRGTVDSTLYSTTSMLRTMELILGLKPMSQFDAAALPMYNSFQPTPNLTPYRCRTVAVDLKARNVKTAWGTRQSNKMNFAREDAADDLLLNEVIWRSVRGAESPMPAPTRAAFVLSRAQGEED